MTLETLSALCRDATPAPWKKKGGNIYAERLIVLPGTIASSAWKNGNPDIGFIVAMRNHAEALIEAARTLKVLIGPDNIGKTVDTNIYWDGAISAIMTGKALSDAVVAIAKLQEIP